MSKIEHTPYDIFVKKLEGHLWKTFLRSDLFRFWQSAGWSKVRFAYALGKAKNQEKLSVLSGGIFRVGRSDIPSIDEDYWDIVALLIREHAPSGAIIAHEKSIEIHMKNYEIPDTLVLYTRDVSKRIEIGPYRFHFRTLQSGEKSKGKNMFRLFEKSSVWHTVWDHTFHTLWIDASLLDVASIKNHESWISEALLLRFIKKYEMSYSRSILWELVAHRYIRSINRIRTIAKLHGFTHLYMMTLDIIKKEGWGCYVPS
jgi:hypothetical protein